MALHKDCSKEQCTHSNIPVIKSIHLYLHDRKGWYHDWHHHRYRMTIHVCALLAALIINLAFVAQMYRYDNISMVHSPGLDWEQIYGSPGFGK